MASLYFSELVTRLQRIDDDARKDAQAHTDSLRREQQRADFLLNLLTDRGVTAFELVARKVESSSDGIPQILALADYTFGGPSAKFLEAIGRSELRTNFELRHPLSAEFRKRFAGRGIIPFPSEPTEVKDEEFLGDIPIAENPATGLTADAVLTLIYSKVTGVTERAPVLRPISGRIAIECKGRIYVPPLPLIYQVGLLERAARMHAPNGADKIFQVAGSPEEWNSVVEYLRSEAAQSITEITGTFVGLRQIFTQEMLTGAVTHAGKTVDQVDPDRLGRLA